MSLAQEPWPPAPRHPPIRSDGGGSGGRPSRILERFGRSSLATPWRNLKAHVCHSFRASDAMTSSRERRPLRPSALAPMRDNRHLGTNCSDVGTGGRIDLKKKSARHATLEMRGLRAPERHARLSRIPRMQCCFTVRVRRSRSSCVASSLRRPRRANE